MFEEATAALGKVLPSEGIDRDRDSLVSHGHSSWSCKQIIVSCFDLMLLADPVSLTDSSARAPSSPALATHHLRHSPSHLPRPHPHRLTLHTPLPCPTHSP